ncbi:hypothetical protein BCV70DRAFT_91171 [Testicularia cyperi]|uniref:EKC/KEOPS complex subunit CGI121 n=1 Tax=Testicularia cyperi TaxID=1882483 RepID=A0A317XV04_9BASI|nr:hypothetical protein BCV70DRAFT_91171 [Testicularia cyperi]
MESIALPATLPGPLECVHLAHFSHLDPATQSARIIERIIGASKLPTQTTAGASAEEISAADQERAKLDFAFIDATKLCSKQHILTAVTQAAIVCARSWDAEHGRFREGEGSSGGMKSRTPHSEVIYMLNPNNNVGDSLKRFGLSPKSTSLLLVKFSSRDANRAQILNSMIDVVAQTTPSQPATDANESSSASATPASAAASRHLTCPTGADPTSADIQLDIDQAIRNNAYTSPDSIHQTLSVVTDWKDLNKIYKLQIPPQLLASALPADLRKYEDIICTTVAMKLVAA